MNKRAMDIVSSCGLLLERLHIKTFRSARRRRVYMSFVCQAGGWHCRFNEDDVAKTPISRRFVFRGAKMVYEAARRGHGLSSMESRRTLADAVSLGRGQILLMLDDTQYEALRRQS